MLATCPDTALTVFQFPFSAPSLAGRFSIGSSQLGWRTLLLPSLICIPVSWELAEVQTLICGSGGGAQEAPFLGGCWGRPE